MAQASRISIVPTAAPALLRREGRDAGSISSSTA
jgi:hypothetical protein